jgi:hypothetical protein
VRGEPGGTELLHAADLQSRLCLAVVLRGDPLATTTLWSSVVLAADSLNSGRHLFPRTARPYFPLLLSGVVEFPTLLTISTLFLFKTVAIARNWGGLRRIPFKSVDLQGIDLPLMFITPNRVRR